MCYIYFRTLVRGFYCNIIDFVHVFAHTKFRKKLLDEFVRIYYII